MDRLTKWDADHGWVENHDNDTREWKNGNRACMEKLGRLEDAQERGRLIELPGTIEKALSFVKLVHCVLSDKRIQRAWTFRAISNARTGERYTLADAEQFLGDFYSVLAVLAEAEAALAAKEGADP